MTGRNETPSYRKFKVEKVKLRILRIVKTAILVVIAIIICHNITFLSLEFKYPGLPKTTVRQGTLIRAGGSSNRLLKKFCQWSTIYFIFVELPDVVGLWTGDAVGAVVGDRSTTDGPDILVMDIPLLADKEFTKVPLLVDVTRAVIRSADVTALRTLIV